MNKLSIRTRMIGGFLLIVVFMGILALLGWRSSERLVFLEHLKTESRDIKIFILECRRE